MGRNLPGSGAVGAAPLKVLLLTCDFPPARGGIQTWMGELAMRLPDARVKVITTAAEGGTSFDHAARLDVRRLRSARFGRLAWLAHLAWATWLTCIVWRPDVIVCGHVVTAPAALGPRWILRIPCVMFTYAWEIRSRRRRWLVTWALRASNLVLAISRFTEQEVLAHGVDPRRVRVLHPGVHVERFARRAEATRAQSAPTLLTVSRLSERYKGHDALIHALPLIKAKFPNIRYVVVGEGSLRGYLTKLAESVGLAGHVVFTGTVSDDELVAWYAASDVLVQPSRESAADGGAEGFGIVCLEAAAARKPVVVGRSGGLTDAVVDGVTGVLVDPNDVGDIADAIVTVLSDPDLAHRLGDQAHERVVREFSWDHMAHSARRLLADVVGRA